MPHHRLLGGLSDSDLASLRAGLEEKFHLERLEVPIASAVEAAAAIEDRLSDCSPDELAVAAVALVRGEAHLLTPRDPPNEPGMGSPVLEKCDTWILHHKAITPALGEQVESAAVSFVHDTVAAVESVLSGESQVAFLLRPVSMELLEEVVRQGERLPPKSTCFYPKLPTGLVFNTLDAEF